MSTPRERLEKIISAQTPSEVVYKSTNNIGDLVILSAVVTKLAERKDVLEDAELQHALSKDVEERWDGDNGKYYIHADVEQLWSQIKRIILREYDDVSTRCNATKRKTELFIQSIKIDDKHLPNYLIQVFLKLKSKWYDTAPRLDREELLEQFEALRRTYGKRS